MIQFKIVDGQIKLPLKSKIILGIFVALGLLFLFLFGMAFFIFALIAGAVLFILNLFQGKNKSRFTQGDSVEIRTHSPFSPPPRPKSRPKDDDIIDV